MLDKEMESLKNAIIRRIQEEFSIKHLSGNLVNTIQVVENHDEIQIIIPAKTYDMLLYRTKGVIVHTNKGSYASQIDKNGSIYNNHKGFVDKVISGAIMDFLSSNKSYELEKR